MSKRYRKGELGKQPTYDVKAILEMHNLRTGSEKTNFNVLCPFHNDHNPSGIVDKETGLFFCRACNAGAHFAGYLIAANGFEREEVEALLAEYKTGVTDVKRRRRRENLNRPWLPERDFEPAPSEPETYVFVDEDGQPVYREKRVWNDGEGRWELPR